jgi:hypothetical protein
MFQNGWRLANFYQRRRRGYFEDDQDSDEVTIEDLLSDRDGKDEKLSITAGEYLDLAQEYLET